MSDFFLVNVPLAGALSVAAGVIRYPVPANADLVRATATVNTAPTGASLQFDVLKNGTSVLGAGNYLTVAASANASTDKVVTAGVANGTNSLLAENANPSPVGSFAAGDYVTVDVKQIGSTVAGSNAVVGLVFQKK